MDWTRLNSMCITMVSTRYNTLFFYFTVEKRKKKKQTIFPTKLQQQLQRLDEWVSFSRLKIDHVEWPKKRSSGGGKGHGHGGAAKTPSVSKKQKGQKQQVKGAPAKAASVASSPSDAVKKEDARGGVAGSSRKRKRGASASQLSLSEEVGQNEEPGSGLDVDDEEDADLAADYVEKDADGDHGAAEPAGFSKEKEIEKLRTSGSMTQSVTEISRVKNIDTIIMGKSEIETWYVNELMIPLKSFLI